MTFFRMGYTAYIGIGSNAGDKVLNCETAISEILKIDRHRLLVRSSFFKTRPIGYTAQDWFVNGVIKIETDLEPIDLFRMLKAIEIRLGRKETFRGGPRVIDLDLLLFDDRRIETGVLQVPHPRLHERQFVLIPLSEIDPNLIHPVMEKTVGELLEEIKEDQGVERL
ncbi:MAG: 2-amino-4-hydroxy-6-hydroxymethyldihydropteridine diphosphokinase [Deltaproteobacteria bacterium]|nr:2-amino-4-hydroxy-6-hydroxymethyldihydropteridine diphosphokinase [Deltaproteobacteria bacterium]